jgi:hypothetical protein
MLVGRRHCFTAIDRLDRSAAAQRNLSIDGTLTAARQTMTGKSRNLLSIHIDCIGSESRLAYR